MKYEVFASKHKAQVGQWPVRGGEAMTSCRKLKSLVIILIAILSCTIHICAQPKSKSSLTTLPAHWRKPKRAISQKQWIF